MAIMLQQYFCFQTRPAAVNQKLSCEAQHTEQGQTKVREVWPHPCFQVGTASEPFEAGRNL